jgi:hypothetical protein
MSKQKIKTVYYYLIYILLIFLLGFILIKYSNYLNNKDKKYTNTYKEKKELKSTIKKDKSKINQFSYLYDIKYKNFYETSQITDYYRKRSSDYAININIDKSKRLNIIALGTDDKYHMSNFYLKNYSPFKISSIYIPLMTIGNKKKYQLDHFGKLRKKEIWQTSKEAYSLPRGDCEDHAIIVADWLIANGEDARVVIGKYKNSGHAWVVLFRNNKEYIIEATSKRSFMKAYSLAKFATDYKASSMFNRNYYWYNTGDKNKHEYRSSEWIKKSIYIRKKKS